MPAVARLPVLAADLTFVKVNGGHAHGHIVNWDEDDAPRVGQPVQLADGGSERLDAVIVDIRSDGTITLTVPAFAAPPPAPI
jgi:hypothetical protein